MSEKEYGSCLEGKCNSEFFKGTSFCERINSELIIATEQMEKQKSFC